MLHLVYSKEGNVRSRSPPRPLLVIPNVTAHPSTASVPITVLLYNGLLLCGFIVAIRGLKTQLLFSAKHRNILQPGPQCRGQPTICQFTILIESSPKIISCKIKC